MSSLNFESRSAPLGAAGVGGHMARRADEKKQVNLSPVFNIAVILAALFVFRREAVTAEI